MSWEALKLAWQEDKDDFRRYTVLGAFDGLIVGLSLVITLGVIENPDIVFHSALSGIAGVSAASFWNTIVAESREKELELKGLERHMLRPLKGTIYERAARYTVWISALIHALSPLIGLSVVFVYLYTQNLVHSAVTGLAAVASLGFMYEGEVKERLKSIAIMVGAGAITALLAYFLRPP